LGVYSLVQNAANIAQSLLFLAIEKALNAQKKTLFIGLAKNKSGIAGLVYGGSDSQHRTHAQVIPWQQAGQTLTLNE